jgi:hypothetical protein
VGSGLTTEPSGIYMRKSRVNGPSGAGSQLDSFACPGLFEDIEISTEPCVLFFNPGVLSPIL